MAKKSTVAVIMAKTIQQNCEIYSLNYLKINYNHETMENRKLPEHLK